MVPPPVRKIPILIGGIGVKRTLPLVAKHADALLDEDVTLFTTEIHPTVDGYDFGELKDMLAWRDRQR